MIPLSRNFNCHFHAEANVSSKGVSAFQPSKSTRKLFGIIFIPVHLSKVSFYVILILSERIHRLKLASCRLANRKT